MTGETVWFRFDVRSPRMTGGAVLICGFGCFGGSVCCFLRGGLEGGRGGLLFLRGGSEVGLEFFDKGVEFDGLVVVEVFELKAAFGVPRASGDVASITQEEAFLCFGILDDGEFP